MRKLFLFAILSMIACSRSHTLATDSDGRIGLDSSLDRGLCASDSLVGTWVKDLDGGMGGAQTFTFFANGQMTTATASVLSPTCTVTVNRDATWTLVGNQLTEVSGPTRSMAPCDVSNFPELGPITTVSTILVSGDRLMITLNEPGAYTWTYRRRC